MFTWILFSAVALAATPNLAKEKGLVFNGIVLEESTFTDVRNQFGENSPKRRGEGGEAKVMSCYKSKDGAIVEFESNVEMADGTVITELHLAAGLPKKVTKPCRLSAKFSKKSAFTNAIKLGMGIQQLDKILGPPKKERDSEREYRFERAAGGEFVETMIVKATFNKAKELQAISVWKVTSN